MSMNLHYVLHEASTEAYFVELFRCCPNTTFASTWPLQPKHWNECLAEAVGEKDLHAHTQTETAILTCQERILFIGRIDGVPGLSRADSQWIS